MSRYLDHNNAPSGIKWGHPSDYLGAIVATTGQINHSSGQLAHTGSPLNI